METFTFRGQPSTPGFNGQSEWDGHQGDPWLDDQPDKNKVT